MIEEEIANWFFKRHRDLLQPVRRDPVGPVFVFLHLLKRNPYGVGEIRLSESSLSSCSFNSGCYT
jgi:hypothetical protein